MNIELSHVTKNYGDLVAVQDVSFRVESGEILGYLGPNGAGKSTTIKMLTGILTPSAGRVLIDGADLADNPLAGKRRIGYLPEAGGLYESLTGFEFMQLVGRLYRLEEEVILHKTQEMFRLFELERVMRHRLSSYSKGMKQKALICAALIHNPDLICLDEPLNGLDANAAAVLKHLLRSLADSGKTVFYCSHILDVVERLCTRVVIIDRGRIVADSPIDKLKEITAHKSLEDVFQQLTKASDASETARRLSALVTGRGQN